MGPDGQTSQSGAVGAQGVTDYGYYFSASGFGEDLADGHGTHTAGSAAGATLANPATTVTCDDGDFLGCIGTCLTSSEITDLLADFALSWDTLCPAYDCDNLGLSCLDDDVSATLTENGGVAQGAKISVFDASLDGTAVWASWALNGLWESTNGTESYLHSNSWGADESCTVNSESVTYDGYMYEVREACGAVVEERSKPEPAVQRHLA